MSKKIVSILNKIGTCILASSYYITAIILSIIIAFAILIYSGLNIYSNTVEQYSNTQIAWNNITSDIYSDISICKKQLENLKPLITSEMEDAETTRNQIKKVEKSIEEIDNAMTYGQQYNLYTYLPTIFNNVRILTKNIDKNNETSFDYNAIISNNKELLDTYNQSVSATNNSINSKLGGIIAKIFNLHTWPIVEIKY